MENQHECWQPISFHTIRKFDQGVRTGPELFDIEQSRSGLPYGNQVVELERFRRRSLAPFVDGFVGNRFGCGEAIDIADKLLNAILCGLQDLLKIA
jgi:hypothetical protein